MIPNVQNSRVPSIHSDIHSPVSDSCNCCQDCNVSCCFPLFRKRKTNQVCPNLERRNSIVEDTATPIIRNSNNK